jgi:hypothetical protein
MPRLLGPSLVLWSFVFVSLCLTSGGKPIAGDAQLMCAAADSWRNKGTFAVEPIRRDVSAGRDGQHFVKYPLLTVMQCVPALALGDLAAEWALGDPAFHTLATQLVSHFVGATLALGMFYLGLQLGLRAAASVLLALFATFTTPIWLGTRSLYSETLQAMLTVWLVLAALRAREPKRWGAWAALGVFCGLAINTKITLAILPVAVAIDQLHERWTLARVRAAACALPGLLLGAAAFLWYNHVRFGDVLAQGYETKQDGELGFSVPLASGVYGLLFSSGKSVFQYAPLLLAAVWAVPGWYRDRRRDLWLIAIPCLVTLGVIGKWWAWSGDWGWGPRLLLPVVPLALVLVARWLHAAAPRAARVWLGVLAAAGLYVQLLGLSVDPSQYLHMVRSPCRVAMGKHPDAPEIRDALLLAHFIPEFNPIVSQQWLLMRYLQDKPELHSKDSWTPWKSLGIRSWRPKYIPTPERLNFWVDGTSSRAAIALQIVFALATVALAVALVWQLRRAGRSERLRARTAQALASRS